MSFLYIGKLLTALASPVVIAAVLLILAAISLRRAPRSLAFRSVLLALVILLVSSSGWISGHLLGVLEDPWRNATIASAPAADAIVVLGGYIRVENHTGRPVEIGAAADRLFCAAELYRASKAPLILLSGGNVTFFKASSMPPEADLARQVLEEWGIPGSSILIEDQSRNTHENAAFSAGILAARGLRRILLVTSAFHMRRAQAAFRRTGLTIIPFAADFLTAADPPDTLLSLLPDAQSAVNSGIAIKEWLGIGVYRLRGWSD